MVMFASNPPLPNAKFGSHFHQTLLGTSSDTLHSSVALHQKKKKCCGEYLLGAIVRLFTRHRSPDKESSKNRESRTHRKRHRQQATATAE